METGLDQRRVLVTGASGGIGGEIVRAFLGEGAWVAAHYHRNRDRALQALHSCAGKWTLVAADLTKEREVSDLFGQVERELGPIEVLVANAGYWRPEDVPLHDMTLDQWNQTLAIDLTAVFLCLREFFRGIVRHRQPDPAAVLIGSTAGIFGEAGHADYAAAKAALTYGLLNSLKNEICRIAPRGRVNAVCPGWIVTPMVETFTSDPAHVQRVLQTIPLRKVGRPSDVAAAVVYLASSRLAGHVSGQILTVSGGMEGRVLYRPEEIDLGKV